MGGPEKPYDCADCLAFCCTVYQAIGVTEADARRLARHKGVTVPVFLAFYALQPQPASGGYILKRKPDGASGDGQCCIFLDTDTRRCTVYDARPQVCREFPVRTAQAQGAAGRCCYYDLYLYVRRETGDPQATPLIQLKRRVSA
jgi:Fe-S-cluster containining protein